jgi:hypothetical protein
MGKGSATITRGQLNSRLEAIARRVKREKIMENAREVMKTQGKYDARTHPYRIEVKGFYKDEDFWIEYHGGMTDYGGARMIIEYADKGKFRRQVFSASDSQEPLAACLDGMYISTYLPGEWVKELRQLAEKGSKVKKEEKKAKVKPEPLSKEDIAKLRIKYGKLI